MSRDLTTEEIEILGNIVFGEIQPEMKKYCLEDYAYKHGQDDLKNFDSVKVIHHPRFPEYYFPAYEIRPKHQELLKPIADLRYRSEEEKKRNGDDGYYHLRGLIGELINLSLLNGDFKEFVQQFNSSLPHNENGDPGFDFIHNGYRLDSKTTRYTSPESIQGVRSNTKEKPDYYIFNRLMWADTHQILKDSSLLCTVLGYASYENAISPKFNISNALWLDKLWKAGKLETNIWKLFNIESKMS